MAVRFVTLTEAVLAIAVLVVHLQLERPLPRWALVVPATGIVAPLLG